MIAIMLDQIFQGLEGARTLTLESGAAVFRQGAPASAMYRVRRGRVAMVRTLSDGGSATVFTAGPMETFAEAAIFAERYHCDAVAQSECEIDLIPAKAVRALLEREPKCAIAFAAFLAGQVRDLRQRIEILRVKRAPDRLLVWIRAQAKGAPPRLSLTAPWSQVATEIGLTPEALYRALRALERSRVIERCGRNVVEVLQ